MASNYQRSLYREYETLHLKHDQLVMEHNLTKEELSWFKTEYYIKVAEKIRLLKQNEELQQEVARMQAKLNIDNNNSSLPVSKTPIIVQEKWNKQEPTVPNKKPTISLSYSKKSIVSIHAVAKTVEKHLVKLSPCN